MATNNIAPFAERITLNATLIAAVHLRIAANKEEIRWAHWIKTRNDPPSDPETLYLAEYSEQTAECALRDCEEELEMLEDEVEEFAAAIVFAMRG